MRQGLGLDGTGHLPDAAETRYFKRLGHAYFAGLGDFAEVVAQQIDNHHVFGAVFRVGLQLGGAAFVLTVAQNRRGAFHRFGADGAVRTDFEEEFGRETQRPRGFPCRIGQVGQNGIGDGLAQAAVETDGIAVGLQVQAGGVVDLIGVAAPDGFVDLADVIEVIGFGYGGLRRGNAGGEVV